MHRCRLFWLEHQLANPFHFFNTRISVCRLFYDFSSIFVRIIYYFAIFVPLVGIVVVCHYFLLFPFFWFFLSFLFGITSCRKHFLNLYSEYRSRDRILDNNNFWTTKFEILDAMLECFIIVVVFVFCFCCCALHL